MLIVLRGISGAGKSKWCKDNLSSEYVLSEEFYRGLLYENQSYTPRSEDVHDIMEKVLEVRMKQGLVTVIDTQNLRVKNANRWINVAKRHFQEYCVISFNVSLDVCRVRTLRGDAPRVTDKDLVEMDRKYHVCTKDFVKFYDPYYHELFKSNSRALGIIEAMSQKRYLHDVHEEEQVWLIGDPHACGDELDEMFSKLSKYSEALGKIPKFYVLGDILDRGPDLFKTYMACKAYDAELIQGNHESNFIEEWFHGKNCNSIARNASHAEVKSWPECVKDEFLDYICTAPHIKYLRKDGDTVICTHGGLQWDLLHTETVPHKFGCNGALYGTGDFGTRPNENIIQVHGHAKWNYDPEYKAAEQGVYNIDAGVVYGDGLVAFDPFDKRFVTVNSKEAYYAYNR
jgi:predicted kinase